MKELAVCSRTDHFQSLSSLHHLELYITSAVSTGYGPKHGVWIDSSSPAIPHYALKWAWFCNNATQTAITPYVTVWAEFREARLTPWGFRAFCDMLSIDKHV